jgi:hypothetical protein
MELKIKVEKQIIMFLIRDPFQFQDLISAREKNILRLKTLFFLFLLQFHDGYNRYVRTGNNFRSLRNRMSF